MSKMTAILAGSTLVGENLKKQERVCVLVQEGRIRDILSPDELEAIRDQVDIIDLGTATLLPGLFECHNHLALDAGLEGHLGMMELSALYFIRSSSDHSTVLFTHQGQGVIFRKASSSTESLR